MADEHLVCVTLRRVLPRDWPELWLRQRWKHVFVALMAFVSVQQVVATSMKENFSNDFSSEAWDY